VKQGLFAKLAAKASSIVTSVKTAAKNVASKIATGIKGIAAKAVSAVTNVAKKVSSFAAKHPVLTTILSTAVNVGLNFIPGGPLIRAGIGALSGAITSIASDLSSGKPINWGNAALSAATGGATALVASFVGETAARTVVGALTGAASAAVSAVVAGQPITFAAVAGAALGGAATGLVSSIPGMNNLPPAARGAIAGAVNGGVTALATGIIGRATGESDQSWGEILAGTAVCAATGAVVGGITGAIGGAIQNRQQARAQAATANAAQFETETTRVGRWMSGDEYDAMVATEQVQMSPDGNRTYVSNPADPDAFTAAPPGSTYVEFDVPSNTVRAAGRSDWGQIPGPGSLLDTYDQNRGFPPITEMPRATNITQVGWK
jgi:hypothetical protein